MQNNMLLGAIVGDVVGSTRERRDSRIKTEDFELLPPRSRFTDDTVMTLAVAEWLLSDPTHSPLALVASMQRLGRRYPKAGYGHKFRHWLTQEHPEPYESFGNGSAMRVSPVGLYASSLEECLRLAHTTAAVSHNHPEGIRGAQAVAACVYLRRTGASRQETQAYVERTFGYDLSLDLEAMRPSYHFDSTCQGSVPVAIACFLQRSTPEAAMRLAISMGGDSDTLAAIALSIACANGEGDSLLNASVRRLLTPDLLDINDRFLASLAKPAATDPSLTDRLRGSLVAGACGDALGYSVEFMYFNEIERQYGPEGITCFDLHNGKALISDDTQMTLATAKALVEGQPVVDAFIEWFYSQRDPQQRRAPGITCIDALRDHIAGHPVENESKGCGTVMRVAPIALYAAAHPGAMDVPAMMQEAMDNSYVTHLHPLGATPSALLVHLIYHLLRLPAEEALEALPSIAEEGLRPLKRHWPEAYSADNNLIERITRQALDLAASPRSDRDAIACLGNPMRAKGNGWVAEEAWAIALFCAARHGSNPRRALLASVNHSGDSDSTGSICGNILGAIHGYDALVRSDLFCPEGHRLASTLELHDELLAMADRLAS